MYVRAQKQKAFIVSLRKAYESTQMATNRVPVKPIHKPLDTNKACHLREQISWCLKYLLYRHLARAYTRVVDRSDQYRRCGENNHVAQEYDEDPKWMMCDGMEGLDQRHIAESDRFAEFKVVPTAAGKANLNNII